MPDKNAFWPDLPPGCRVELRPTRDGSGKYYVAVDRAGVEYLVNWGGREAWLAQPDLDERVKRSNPVGRRLEVLLAGTGLALEDQFDQFLIRCGSEEAYKETERRLKGGGFVYNAAAQVGKVRSAGTDLTWVWWVDRQSA